MTDAHAEIRKALEAGPTPGPWAFDYDSRIATVATVAHYRVGYDYGSSSEARYDGHASNEVDAAYIAACNPEAIRALLAERDALEADAKRYRWLRNRIPGSSYRIAGVIYSEGGPGVDAAIDSAIAASGAGKL